eukprot:tig00020960_g16586.t1
MSIADAGDAGEVRLIALVNLKSGSRNENEAVEIMKRYKAVKQIYLMGSSGFDLIYESLPDGTPGVVHLPTPPDEGTQGSHFPSQAVVPSETRESPTGEQNQPRVRSAKQGSRSASGTPYASKAPKEEVGRSRSCVDGKLAEVSVKAQRLKRLPVSEKTRLMVVGGDGSMNWALSTMDELGVAHHIMPLPFGTGNDLARSLGWGHAATPGDLLSLLPKIEVAEIGTLDRWQVDIFEEGNAPGPPGAESHPLPSAREVFTNCFSIGHDAKLTLDINTLREEAPRLFPHRSITKAWYVMEGVKGVFEKFDFSKVLAVSIDGKPVRLPQPMGMLILSNIDSYADGLTLWRDREKPQDFGDGLLEVVALEGPLHLALSHARIRAPLRLGQGKEIRIKVSGEQALPMQTDGEPWLQRVPCELRVTLRNKVPVLVGPIRARPRAMSVSEGMANAAGAGAGTAASGEEGGAGGSRGPTPEAAKGRPSPVKSALRELISKLDADVVSSRDFVGGRRSRRSPAPGPASEPASPAKADPVTSLFARLRNSFKRAPADGPLAALACGPADSDPDPSSGGGSEDEAPLSPASPPPTAPSAPQTAPSVPPSEPTSPN